MEGGEDFYVDIEEDEWQALEQNDRMLVGEDRRVGVDQRSIANQPLGPVQPTIPGIGGEDYFCFSWGYRPGTVHLTMRFLWDQMMKKA